MLDLGVTPLARGGGDYLPERIGPLRDDLKPLEVHQPEGVSFTVDGHEVSLAAVAVRGRVLAPGRPGAAQHPLRRRRARAAGLLPGLVRRAGDPVRGPAGAAQLDQRVRRRRVRDRAADQLADPRLRLPRPHQLPGRARLPPDHGRAPHHRERDLPARGGRRAALEALRRRHRPRRGAPVPAVRGELGGHRRATTSTRSTGTSTRTARSRPRSGSPASCSPPGSPTARRPGTGRRSTRASSPPTTSTSSPSGCT